MSNYALKSTVNQLEAQLREIERENDRLRSEISSTVNQVNMAQRELSNYNDHIRSNLEGAAGSLDSSTARTLEAYELQGQIDRLYKRYKCKELANKRIRALNNKKYYEFNNYRTVRKIVRGMMDNLDLNLIGDRMIYKSIERQHLQIPDFWLTCVLISIMAWKNDDRALADRAMENAVKLDRKNSSIFYMIFNLRMEREMAAVKWFMLYQQCELKGSDEDTFLMLFSLVSRTLADNVDEETAGQIREFINRVILKSAEREGYSEDSILELIQKHMQSLMTAETYDLPLLSRYCKGFGRIQNMLNLANNNYHILEFILRVVTVPVDEKNTYLKEFLDELLAKPNPSEEETYREIAYNELIIALDGDMEAAKARFEEEKKRQESELDLVSSIIRWIYDFSMDEVNGQMRFNMFTLIREFQEKAANRYFDSYRAMHRTVLPVQINDYGTDVDFTAKSQEIGKMETFYRERLESELAGIKNTSAYIAFGAGVVSCVAAYFLHPLLLGLSAACFLGGALRLVGNKRQRRNLELSSQESRRGTQEILEKLFTEFERCEACYHEMDDVSGKILEELAKL